MTVPLTSEKRPSTSVTPTSATEKPTFEWDASTENFSAAKLALESRRARAATTMNRCAAHLFVAVKQVFICLPRLPGPMQASLWVLEFACRLLGGSILTIDFGMNG